MRNTPSLLRHTSLLFVAALALTLPACASDPPVTLTKTPAGFTLVNGIPPSRSTPSPPK